MDKAAADRDRDERERAARDAAFEWLARLPGAPEIQETNACAPNCANDDPINSDGDINGENEAERAEFAAWLAADPAHGRAYEEAARLRDALAASPELARLAEAVDAELIADAARAPLPAAADPSANSLSSPDQGASDRPAHTPPTVSPPAGASNSSLPTIKSASPPANPPAGEGFAARSGARHAQTPPGRAARLPRGRALLALAPLAALFLLTAAASLALLQRPFAAGDLYETATGAARTVPLEDGSVVELAPDSRIRVQITPDRRRVALLAGEAFFTVARDEHRDFIVLAGDARIRVLGTRFNVHRGPAKVTVAVEEGLVRVRRDPRFALPGLAREAASDERPLTAGQKVSASVAGIGEPADAGAEPAGAWRDGLLIYRDSTLEEVVADLNRYSAREIVIASPALSQLRVMAAFRTERMDEMLDGLEGLLPLEVDRADPGRIVLRSRKPA